MAHFIFNSKVLSQNISKLQDAFRQSELNFDIFYSVKTNSSAPVLDVVNEQCSFEIVSAYEWEKVKNYNPNELTLNGPSKTAELVQEILGSSVDTLYFNIENDTDVEIVQAMDKNMRKRTRLGLRLYLNRSGIWNRFGFDIESERTTELLNYFGKEIDGIHFHFSTNNFKLDNYDAMLDAIQDLCKRHKLQLSYLDIGGGLPGASDHLFSKQMYDQLPRLIATKLPTDIRIISEVGRNLVEDTFELEAEVVSVKKVGKNKVDIAIDTNIMHFPCFWEKKYSIQYKPSHEPPSPMHATIFGNSCMQADQLADNFPILSMPKVGDKLTITKVGAYSLTQASNFITKIPSVEVV